MSMRSLRPRRAALAGLVGVPLLALTACGGDAAEPADAAATGVPDEAVTLSILVDNAPANVATVEALGAAFSEQNPNVTFDVEQRPGGGEGDNIVKTRLATGDMTELFFYNSGSLLQALNPQQTLTPLTEQAWVDSLVEPFPATVTADGELYGAPVGTAFAGAMFYHKPTYDELGLEIPQTWDEFMANNEEIQAAGITPVIQTYQDTWTSQLFVLGDFHNVLADNPEWAEQYTANEAKYADDPVARRGFEKLQEVHDAGFLNDDFASASFVQGMEKVATGEGAHYPMLTGAITEVLTNNPDNVEDVGVFGIPGDDAASSGVTIWAPNALYVPRSTEGAELQAALAFLDFVVSPEGCDVQSESTEPTGPYLVDGCQLPDDVVPAAEDLQAYFDEERTSPALEFLSPVKGPALEQITVEVGSGIRSAEDGAALYDQDVEKQAQQLGLEGW
jgi:raffinose/stachyose/melibiose transport system substrate-binding protein